ncbi:MAG: hypothetical protein ACRYGR_07970 [Janthinobacterium lividum]
MNNLLKIIFSFSFYVIFLPLSWESFSDLEKLDNLHIKISFINLPTEDIFNIFEHVDNHTSLITFQRVSKDNENLVKAYLLNKFRFLKDDKYLDNQVRLIDQYFHRTYDFHRIQASFEHCLYFTRLLEKEFHLLDQLNILDIMCDSVPQNPIKIIRKGISFLRERLNKNVDNSSQQERKVIKNIFLNLEFLIGDDPESLTKNEEDYLLAKFYYLRSQFHSKPVVKLGFESKARLYLTGIHSKENPYQNKAQYFAWKYKIIYTNPNDIEEREKLLKDAAEGGHVQAQYEYGRYHEDLALREQDVQKRQEYYDKTLKYYKAAADQRNAKALSQLGDMYLEGRGIPASLPEEALIWYMKAAFLGYTKAATRVGLMYYAGIGVPEEDFPLTDGFYQELIRPEFKKWWKTAYEHSKAFSWWHEAAHQDDAEAQFYLGWMYQNGFGIEKNQKYAKLYYQKAADQGDTAAAIKLGLKTVNDFTDAEKQVLQRWDTLINSNDLIKNFNVILRETERMDRSISPNILTFCNVYKLGKIYKRFEYRLSYFRVEVLSMTNNILNIENNLINDIDLKLLIQLLSYNKYLNQLNLKCNRIGDLGARYIGKALKDTQIHTLNLSGNNIGADGARELGQALKDTHIHNLNLSVNRINDEGARDLGKALKNTQIRNLDLAANLISDAGAQNLGQVLKDTNIYILDLFNNNISQEMQIILKERLPKVKIIF